MLSIILVANANLENVALNSFAAVPTRFFLLIPEYCYFNFTLKYVH